MSHLALMLTLVQTTRSITVPTPIVVDGVDLVKKVKVEVPAVEVQYDGLGVAIFYQENTKGSLLEAVEKYLQTHGYLAKWYAERWKQRPLDLGWSDDMVIDTSGALASCRALREQNPTL